MKKDFLFLLLFMITLISSDDYRMNYIIDNIYLGNHEAASNEDYLKQYSITTVVNCAHQDDIVSDYKDIKFLELNLIDDPVQNLFPKFEVAYKFIKKNSKNNILIHCYSGISRSASLVIFYLMKEKGWDYDTCNEYILERRPSVDPNSGFIKQLKKYYDKYIKK